MKSEVEKGNSLEKLMALLASDEKIPIGQLYHLSDIQREDFQEFCEKWPTIPDERRRVITRHLADISESNYTVDFSEVLSYCLTDNMADVRLASLDGLWDSDRVDLIQSILNLMLNDPEVEIRTAAAANLGHFILLAEWDQLPMSAVESSVEALLDQLDNPDAKPSTRRAALESLGASSDVRVNQRIENAYDAGDRSMRISALFAMGRSADSRWISRIIESLDDDNVDTRLEAVRAAGAIGDGETVPDLAGLAYDEEFDIRLEAVYALGKIGTADAQAVLEEILLDPDSSELHEAVEETFEEAIWLGSDIDFDLFNLTGDQPLA